jgi:glycosyltransferase involved in cell wall biosynthesis
MKGALRVGIDDQIFTLQRRGGISRYVVELFSAFVRDPALGIELIPGWRWTRNEHVLDAPHVPGRAAPLLGGKERLYSIANTLARCKSRSADVLHHTYYHPHRLGRWGPDTRVVTVHDMIPELFPEHFTMNVHLAKEQYVRQAAVVLCVSRATETDLRRVYGAIDTPVVVTHLGVAPAFSPSGPISRNLPQPFVLFVGARGAYKDFDVLVEAFAGAATRFRSIVAVGGGPFTQEEEAYLARLGLKKRVHHVDVSDEELPRLYRTAGVFVFPSRYEGFGLPTLEAMASGCPVILADSSSHPEVGGDAALYFPPGHRERLRALLEECSEDEVRATLVARSLARAKGFTWDATARATARAYELGAER